MNEARAEMIHFAKYESEEYQRMQNFEVLLHVLDNIIYEYKKQNEPSQAGELTNLTKALKYALDQEGYDEQYDCIEAIEIFFEKESSYYLNLYDKFGRFLGIPKFEKKANLAQAFIDFSGVSDCRWELV